MRTLAMRKAAEPWRLHSLRHVPDGRGGAATADLPRDPGLSGRSITHHDDSELKLENGDAMLATRGPEGFAIIRPMPVRFIGLRVQGML